MRLLLLGIAAMIVSAAGGGEAGAAMHNPGYAPAVSLAIFLLLAVAFLVRRVRAAIRNSS